MTYPSGWRRTHRHHHLRRRRDESCRDAVDAVLTGGQSDGGRDDKKHEATGDIWNVEGAMGLRHREDMPAGLFNDLLLFATAKASRSMTLQRRQEAETAPSTTSEEPPETTSDQPPESTEGPDTPSEEPPPPTTTEDPPPTSTSDDPPPSTTDNPPPPSTSDDPPPPSTSDDPPPSSTTEEPPPPPSTTEEPPPPPSTTEEPPPPPPSTSDEPPPSSSSEPPPPPSSSSEPPSSSSEPPPSSSEPPPSSSEPPPSSSSEPPPSSSPSSSSSSQPPSSSEPTSSSTQPPSSSEPTSSSTRPPSSSEPTSSSTQPPSSSEPTSSSTQPPSSSEPTSSSSSQPPSSEPTASSTSDEPSSSSSSSSSSSTAPSTTPQPPGSTIFVPGDDTTTYESVTRTVDPSSTPGTLGTDVPNRDEFASNTGAIVGVAIGSAAALLLLALLVFYLMRWHRQNRDNRRLEQTSLGAAALSSSGAGGGRGGGNRRSVALLEDDEMLQLHDGGSGRTDFGHASSEGHSTSGLLAAGAVVVGGSSRPHDRKRHSDSHLPTATYQSMTLHQTGAASEAYLPDILTPSLEDGTAYPAGTGYTGAQRSRSLMVANHSDDASPVENPPANHGLLSRGPSTIQFADPPLRPPPVPLPHVQHPEQRPKSPDSPVSNEAFSMISHSSYSQASHSNQALHRPTNAALLNVGHIGGSSNSGSGSGSGSAPNSNQNSQGSPGFGSSASATLLDPTSGQDSSSSGHGHVQSQGKYPPTSYFSVGKGKGRAQYFQSGPSSEDGGLNNSSSSHLSHSNEHESSQSHSGHGSSKQLSASMSRPRSKSGTLRSTSSVKGLSGLINRLRAAAGSPAHSDDDDDEYDDFGSGRRGTFGAGNRRQSGSVRARGPIPILETTSPVGRVKRVSAPSTPVLSPKPVVPVGAAHSVEHSGNWSSDERVAQLRTPQPGTLGALPKWTWTEGQASHRPPWTPHELPPTPHSGDSGESYYAEGLLNMGPSGSSHGHGVARSGSIGHAAAHLAGPSKGIDATGARTSDEAPGTLGVLHEDDASNRSQASLVDHVDYSRPFGGWVFNRMHSTATFATTATDQTGNTSPPPSILDTPPAIQEGPERELRLQS